MPVGGNFTNCNCGPAVDACQSPTEPVATVGLCLPDGTPIAVTIVRDCAGGTVQEGWLNLTSGAWSAGQPPAGTIACGDSRSIQVSGTFCDIAPDTGDVLGLVLIEYSYAADGSIAGVRLVDAVTGATYTPQGEVTTCPAGVEQPERDLVTLCDVSDDESGTLETVPFLRDYQRDENGQVVGHSDYTLDGAPYTPTGQVGSCQPDEPCASSVTVLRLCDLNPDVAPDDEGRRCAVPFLRHLVYDCDGALIEIRDTAMDGTTPYTPVQVVDCGDGGVPALVEVPWDVVDIQPDPASEDGLGLIFSLSPVDDPSTVGTVTVTTSSVYNPASCPTEPPDYSYRNPTTYTFTPDQVLRDAATYVRCDLIDFDTFEPVTALTPPPDRLGGTAYWDGTTVRPTESNGTGEMYYDGPPETWSYRVGNTGGGNSCSMLSFSAVSLRPEGCCGCDTGTAEDPCRDSTALLLCDVPSDGADGSPTAADTDPIGYPNSTAAYQCVNPVAGGGATLWSGGALTVPADTTAAGTCNTTVNEQVLRGVAATLQADRPACDSGEATVTAALRFREDGPSPTAANYRGGLRIHRADTGARLASAMLAADALTEPSPVGYQETLTVSATVPAALLAAGQIVVAADVETFEGGAGNNAGAAWTLDEFTASYAFAQDGCATQFLRTVLTDCQTGEILSVTDTTFDGDPYEVTGEAAQCAPAGGGDTTPEPCRDSSTLLVCDTADQGEMSGVLSAAPVADASPFNAWLGYGAGAGTWCQNNGDPGSLFSGGSATLGPGAPCQTASSGTHEIIAAVLDSPAENCREFTLTASVRVTNLGPAAGFQGDGRTALWNTRTGTLLAFAAVAPSTPPGDVQTVTVSATVDGADLRDGNIVFSVDLETEHAGAKSWTVDQFSAAFDGVCITSTQFLRTVVTDCESGQVVSISDTTLDGQPYEVTGEVGQCVPAGGGDGGAEPCRDSTALLVCDLPTGGTPDPVVTDTDPTGLYQAEGQEPVAGGGAALWGGGALTIAPDTTRPSDGAVQFLRTVAATVQAPRPGCDTGTATVTATLRYERLGPDPGCLGTGMFSLVNGTAFLATAGITPTSIPVGHANVLTVTAQVPAADLAAGNLRVFGMFETYHWSPGSCPGTGPDGARTGGWDLDDFALTVTYDQTGCESQFLRTVTTDCETGQVVSTVDTTLDGQPYTPTGTVGQCVPAAACCDPIPPERRVDVENELACLTDQASGEVLARVLLERVYDDQTGELADMRVTDPMTGAAVEVPDGAVVGSCEAPCPTAFATECVGIVARSEASYNNTSLIGGEPGQCGSVQGPSDATTPGAGAQFGCGGGPYTITSWIVDGVEVIAEGGGRAFDGGVCGPGTAAAPGMHANWAEALTNLDPTGATWIVDQAPACAWHIRSQGGTGTVYGPMTIEGPGASIPQGTWILGPAQACEETQYTKVYRQDCDGAVSVIWLDQAGTEIAPPEGVQVLCGTGCSPSGGQGLDVEVLTLCDVQADGTPVPFLRHLTYDTGGTVSLVVDTALDGFAPYTPSGTVTTCGGHAEVELTPMCVLDNGTGAVISRVLAEVVYDTATGERLAVRYVDPATWGPVPLPAGTRLGACPQETPECRDTTSVLLCDAPASNTVTITPDLTDGTVQDVGQTQFQTLPGSYAALWSGGSLEFPATAGPAAQHGMAVGRVTADVTGCEDAAGTLTVSVRVTNNGPDAGQAWDGALRLFRGTTLIAGQDALTWAPPGYTQVLTVSAPVTAADLAAGDLRVGVVLETYHLGAKAWTASEFSSEVVLEGCEETVSVQFVRTLVTDCESGEIVSTTDTTLDGAPYTVTGTVEQCRPADSGGEECCPTEQTVPLCDTGPGGTTPFLRRITYTPGVVTPNVSDWALDGVTPYQITGTVDVCGERPSTILEECRCDDTDGDGIADTDYVELVSVAADGTLTTVGTYTADLSGPYEPVSPVDCAAAAAGAPPVTGVQAERVEVEPGGSWSAASVPGLQSVTVTAHDGAGQIATAAGTSTLRAGETATWSVVRDGDAALTGPLTVTAGPGTLAVTYTRAVAL